MNLKKEFNNFMKNSKLIVDKYMYSQYSIDFDKIVNEELELRNQYIKKLSNQYTKYINQTFYKSLFWFLLQDLNRTNYKTFLKKFKHYKLYRYCDYPFLAKYFLHIYACIFFIIDKKDYFFKSKICPNNKIRFIFNNIKNLGLLNFLKGKIYIDYIELVITTRCTLNCKNCSNLMSLYKKYYNVDENTIINSIKKLDKCVDKIDNFRILGGEPFCNPNLNKYLDYLPYNKINKVTIYTNGTIVPNNDLLKKIKEKNIFVEISFYGPLSRKITDLEDNLKLYKINYQIIDKYNYKKWYDYGTVELKNKNISQLNKQFHNCDNRCRSILNGCIYYCPRASHGYDLNIIERKKYEYVDLINNSDKLNKKEIKKLYKRNKYIEACKYCNYGTEDAKYIQAAIQK